jgi:hypothetical protein
MALCTLALTLIFVPSSATPGHLQRTRFQRDLQNLLAEFLQRLQMPISSTSRRSGW